MTAADVCFPCATGASDNTLFSFEGPEKTLEIDFVLPAGSGRGARAVARSEWDAILAAAACQILSVASNDVLDAYVLSESSLFVYANKVIAKTCGTTTLLKLIPLLLDATRPLGLEVEWVAFVRKNFNQPEKQLAPHTSFADEVAYLQRFFPGEGHVLGPVTADHCCVFVADLTERRRNAQLEHVLAATAAARARSPLVRLSSPTAHETRGLSSRAFVSERTFVVMMYGLDAAVAETFFSRGGSGGSAAAEEATTRSGIRDLFPSAVIDDYMFEPCGYSMNGMVDDAYFTIHITPESHCSYASFESNHPTAASPEFLRRLLAIFCPRRFTVTLFAQDATVMGKTHPLDVPVYDAPATKASCDAAVLYFHRACRSANVFDVHYSIELANYLRIDPAVEDEVPMEDDGDVMPVLA